MKEPRRSWNEILARLEISRNSAQEADFIRRYFPGSKVGTFRCDLSRGFTADHARRFEEISRLAEYPFDEAVWIRPKKGAPSTQAEIKYVGSRIANSEAFYDQLAARYRLAERYDSVRVGGLFSRNRTSFSEFDEVGLALRPNPASVRMPYLRVFWERLKKSALKGHSVHVVRTTDRLVDLWACAEILRKLNLYGANPVYLAPIAGPVARGDYAVMGVRVIDGEFTLLSIPPRKIEDSRYSNWIQSRALAEFATKYVEWGRVCGEEITSLPSDALEKVMTKAFDNLRRAETHSSNYGSIDTIDKAKVVKNRMIELALNDEWYPVIA
jgi:hypothetical protein